MSDILQEVHDSWKEKGFPFYPKDRKWRDNRFLQLMNFKMFQIAVIILLLLILMSTCGQ